MATSLSLDFVQARELVESKAMLNALTIDVEEYFHVTNLDRCVARPQWEHMESRVEAGTYQLLDLLGEAGVRATFFVLGWVAERQARLVRRIQIEGHEIASHGYGHDLLYSLKPEEFRKDLRRSRRVLEDVIGKPVTMYRAPSFSIVPGTLWALDVLIEEGYVLDSSIYPTRHDRYGIPGAPLEPYRIEREVGHIWEFPPPVWPILGWPVPVGGGGYFRLYPYALTKWALHRINASGRPFAFYLHPWEVDTEQPRLRPGFPRGFRHYVNLHRTEDRLRRLLQEFPFGTISQALDRLTGEGPLPTHSFNRAA
jgi:polysaccharide deacetylase family protein (PEP-CTERM system associated)